MTTASANPEPIRAVSFNDALSERYLAYAMSTITSRSLPDVRDGLKPVQRRLLYAMRELRLDPGSGYKKCARVVGDVIGKFHPHGDVAVYDALVRLAQSFAQRYPLIEGQGNFGNIDGDNAAAMRYTESRLTAVAMALLARIDEDTVDFRANYDGSEEEPVVLPAAFPNLLANGATGIAVGMATSIPPHNAGEVLKALAAMLKRDADAARPTVRELMKHIKGPDLPTGGVLVEAEESLIEAYETGRGSVRLRARWFREELAYGQYQIVVTEMPYQVQKSRLVEKLAELLNARRVPLLGDIRDESAEDIRLVLVPRNRSVPAEAMMEQLFRLSDLEVRLSLNMNVLDKTGVPRVMGLGAILEAFIEHRMEVLVRRSRWRIGKIDDRLEILEGYLKAFLDIDRVIAIIREHDEPKAELMAVFALTERQAEAVLNLRLRHLRRLEEMELRAEETALRDERLGLQTLLDSEPARRQALRQEMLDAFEKFGKGPLGARRTELAGLPEIEPEALELPVERYAVTVILSQKGWARTVRGRIEKPEDLKYKEGDKGRFLLEASSADKLLLWTSDGRCFTILVDKLPSGRGTGEPIGLIADLPEAASIVALMVHRRDGTLLVATRKGRGFKVAEAEITAATRAGRQVVNIAAGDSLARVVPCTGDSVAVIGTNRKLLVFAASELPEMSRGRGVILQRYKEGELCDVMTLDIAAGLAWPMGERQRRETDLGPWKAARASAGRNAPLGFPRSNRFDGVNGS